jgi:hypothetical protein
MHKALIDPQFKSQPRCDGLGLRPRIDSALRFLRVRFDPLRAVGRVGTGSLPIASGAVGAVVAGRHGMGSPQPGGYVHISGPCALAHRSELVRMILHYEVIARTRNPARRVLSIEKRSDSTIVLTTALGFARELGVALHLTYSGGSLYTHYSDEGAVACVHWQR